MPHDSRLENEFERAQRLDGVVEEMRATDPATLRSITCDVHEGLSTRFGAEGALDISESERLAAIIMQVIDEHGLETEPKPPTPLN